MQATHTKMTQRKVKVKKKMGEGKPLWQESEQLEVNNKSFLGRGGGGSP